MHVDSMPLTLKGARIIVFSDGLQANCPKQRNPDDRKKPAFRRKVKAIIAKVPAVFGDGWDTGWSSFLLFKSPNVSYCLLSVNGG